MEIITQSQASATVTVGVCECAPPPCPTISVSCPDSVDQGAAITFTASVVGGTGKPDLQLVSLCWHHLRWSGYADYYGRHRHTGRPDCNRNRDVGGLDPACSRTASCSTAVRPPPPQCTKFDEYGNIKFNDEKARLDNFAVQLQNAPRLAGLLHCLR